MGGKTVNTLIIEKPVIEIGRSPDCDVVIDNPGISRKHAHILMSPKKEFMLSDLNSSNGTYLNNMKLDKPMIILNNDVIRIGKFEIHFETDAAVAKTVKESQEFQEKTVMFAKAGSAFVTKSEIKGVATKPRLIVLEGDAEPKAVTIDKNMLTIGKDKNSDIVLTGLFTPKTQAVITINELGDYFITNTGKENGTLVNGVTVKKNHHLNLRDVITILGKFKLVIR